MFSAITEVALTHTVLFYILWLWFILLEVLSVNIELKMVIPVRKWNMTVGHC